MDKINFTEEQRLDIKEMQTLLEGFSQLDKSRKEILLATLTGMRLAVEADRQIRGKN
ncbi:hypothetical protein [Alkaliphilus sp. B6464]|uniref:hypothetical protein n=1 Tax=Alkaliphilus sp. B6464 TaxID=2731219 RepID=UPI001BA7BFE1|nr:hypothetical protein [Alkaliphilus sp. B6464]QUH21108.1 hypothetical protein HYG84_15275 [Alkaliphilus sp. B6464]